jgi:small multidrug resistance pump
MLPYYAALLGGICLGVAGQVSLKMGAEGAGTIARQFLHPASMIGLVIYGFASILYMIAIKKIPLSLAYPTVSLGYVIVGIIAHVMWREPFGGQQIAGIALIGSGILLLHL